MAAKCVHKGCGKTFTESDGTPCTYHPGPPEFHEGQKGWKCCKTRVLTFDEFMNIPPCTTGEHSAIEDVAASSMKATQVPETTQKDSASHMATTTQSSSAIKSNQPATAAAAPAPAPSSAPAPEQEADESDDPDAVPAKDTTCKRKTCGVSYDGKPRDSEACVHHPGHALFHEGSKGWTCCKKRVLDFDEFLSIPGCTTKSRHCFIGRPKDVNVEQRLDTVRHDFYQTGATVIASLYLKKVDKSTSTIVFASPTTIDVDLKTTDRTRYERKLTLSGPIDTAKSTYKVMGTKVELELHKVDSKSWTTLLTQE